MCVAETETRTSIADVLGDLFRSRRGEPATPEAAGLSRRRRLWELPHRYHCPIIGTCLGVEELRKLARRAGMDEADIATDYMLHSAAVGLAGERNPLSESMQKELERKFEITVARFAKAPSDEEVMSLWRAAMETGEIAAAFWAVMSHRRALPDLAHRVYEDVHMLSHQVGSASRADLRELARLRRENADFAARMAQLRGKLAEKRERKPPGQERAARLDTAPEAAAVAGLQARCAELERRLEEEIRRSERLEKEKLAAQAAIGKLKEVEESLRGELAAGEQAMATLLQPSGCGQCGEKDSCPGPDLAGRCVLCVGGRPGMADRYRSLAERCNARFVHHDGGIEDSPKRLQAMLAAADAVICPADRVSHDAYYTVKRLCKQYGKPCVLLRNSGLSSFAQGLAALDGAAEGLVPLRSGKMPAALGEDA